MRSLAKAIAFVLVALAPMSGFASGTVLFRCLHTREVGPECCCAKAEQRGQAAHDAVAAACCSIEKQETSKPTAAVPELAGPLLWTPVASVGGQASALLASPTRGFAAHRPPATAGPPILLRKHSLLI